MVKVYRSRYARLMVGPGEVFTPLPEPAGNARGELVTDDPGLQERLEHSAAFGIEREIWLHETDGQMEPPPPGGDVAEGYDAMTKARLFELAEIRCPGIRSTCARRRRQTCPSFTSTGRFWRMCRAPARIP